ncbi:MAG: glycosyltransferase family 4 protein [Candidatus Pacebacteria bacterium]|nr:glycosyltransferase family 4 protein [Candidatus Paceibacterota bacterium]
MKILITTGVYPPDIGGPATYSKLLFDELPKRGIEVDVLSFGEVRFLPKIIRHIIYFFKILKKSKGVGIIYAQDPVSVGLPTMLASKILNKRFFIRIAGDYAWEQGVQRFDVKDNLDDFSAKNKGYSFMVRVFKKIQKTVANSADMIIVPSQYFKGIISNWGIEPSKINAIYNGIKISQQSEVVFSNDIKDESTNKEKVLLSVGRLVPWKGFDVLIECMPEILKNYPNLKLKIIGSGPQKENLEKIINKLNLRDDVFLTGQLEREKTLKCMEEADLFILNTQYEGFAHQLIEVANLKTPIITTNIGGNPELIENNKEGILIEPNNKQQIIDSIIKVLKNNEFREDIVKNAFIKSQQFSIQNTLDQLEKLLKITKI